MTDETVYEVEEIQSSRIIRGKQQFFIKWRNFPVEDNTWEPEENLDCPDLIASYLAKHQAGLAPMGTAGGYSNRNSATVVPSVAEVGSKNIKFRKMLRIY